jgi:hypothetical protein
MVGYHEKKHGNTWEKWKTLEKHMIFGLGKDTKRSYQGEFEESMGLEWDTIVSSGTSRGGTKSPNQRGAQYDLWKETSPANILLVLSREWMGMGEWDDYY